MYNNNPYLDDSGNKLSIKEKKQILKQYSVKAKALIQSKGLDLMVNEVLPIFYADLIGTTEFHTYNTWKGKGYKVKEGERAFCVWSKPRKTEREIDQDTTEEYEFFGIAHVFGKHQVEPIENRPEYNKVYALTGENSIASGKTWAESEIKE